MSEFKIVDRSHIPQKGGRGNPPSELSLALVRGDAVFIPKEPGALPPAAVMNLYAKHSFVRQRGLQPRTRQGVEDGVVGIYVWAEKNGTASE